MDTTAQSSCFPSDGRNIYRGMCIPGPSLTRARCRLLALAAVTAVQMLRFAVERLAAGIMKRTMGAEMRIRLLHRWAIAVSDVMGVRVSVIGTPPPEGSLIVANHRSYIDIAVLGASAPMTFLAKSSVRSWPLIGYGCRLTGVVFVDRENPGSRGASRDGIAGLLCQGASIAVFPEGTSHDGTGTLPFKKGCFKTAATLGIPVVPVAIEYHDRRCAWTGNDTFMRHFLDIFSGWRVFVMVYFGPVLRSRDAEHLRETSRDWIDKTLLLLQYGSRRG